MSSAPIEEILQSALKQAEQRVEACVVFLDSFVGAAMAELVLRAQRWSICVADEYTLVRALGAAQRFPDLEIVACLHVESSNLRHIQRCAFLADEMALTNLRLFCCGERATDIEGSHIFECEKKPELYTQQWLSCPVHMQHYAITEEDCAQPQDILRRIRTWSDQEAVIELWDVQQYGDVAMSLMAAAQYAAQGRQVWCMLDAQDLFQSDVLAVAEAIGRARLPLKCIFAAPSEELLHLPWSRWARLQGWWVQMPIDAAEAQAWLQSSIDHLWPSLLALPPRWFTGLDTFRFAHMRQVSQAQAHISLVCAPNVWAMCLQAAEALSKIHIMVNVQIITSLAPLMPLQCEHMKRMIIVDHEIQAPLSDILLPQLQLMPELLIYHCGPQQCQGAEPTAADIAATVRSAIAEAQ